MYIFHVIRTTFCLQCRVRKVICELKKYRKERQTFPPMWWGYINYWDIKESTHAQK
ncbi:MAG: hypothetical protein [Microvirus sp.]|nr:MAG: hypothetical protein [Microvirus sp.]